MPRIVRNAFSGKACAVRDLLKYLVSDMLGGHILRPICVTNIGIGNAVLVLVCIAVPAIVLHTARDCGELV